MSASLHQSYFCFPSPISPLPCREPWSSTRLASFPLLSPTVFSQHFSAVCDLPVCFLCFFFLKKDLFICIYESYACTHVCTPYAPGLPEESFRPRGTEVINCCEPWGHWELIPHYLQEQQVILMAEPQPGQAEAAPSLPSILEFFHTVLLSILLSSLGNRQALNGSHYPYF